MDKSTWLGISSVFDLHDFIPTRLVAHNGRNQHESQHESLCRYKTNKKGFAISYESSSRTDASHMSNSDEDASGVREYFACNVYCPVTK